MLLHIPHSSSIFPIGFGQKLPIDEVCLHTDWFTDELFSGHVRFVYPYSRFFCDVERLVNDPLEAEGRGIAYTKLMDGTIYRSLTAEEVVTFNRLHDEWHRAMKREAEKQSSMLDNVVVVDCHSFNATQVNLQEDELPDVCIGFNDDQSKLPTPILGRLIEIFSAAGYSVSLNRPYGNAIVVSVLPNIYSVMVEVNKRVYLTDRWEKSDGFQKIKSTIDAALKFLIDFEVGIISVR